MFRAIGKAKVNESISFRKGNINAVTNEWHKKLWPEIERIVASVCKEHSRWDKKSRRVIKIGLFIAPIGQSSKDKKRVQVMKREDIEKAVDKIYSEFNPPANWMAIWALSPKLQRKVPIEVKEKSKKVTYWENYPGVCFFATVTEGLE